VDGWKLTKQLKTAAMRNHELQTRGSGFKSNEELILLEKLGCLTLPSPKERVPKKSEVKVLSFGEDWGEAKCGSGAKTIKIAHMRYCPGWRYC
jgi:hypothetical protein